MPVTIRLADTKDGELIATLSRQTFYETFASFNTKENMDKFMNEQFTAEKLMAETGEAGNIFLLAYDGDEPVGYAKLNECKESEELKDRNALEIVRIYAVTRAIGKGVGSALMQRCLETAAAMNKEVVWLGVWEHNHRAIDFYTRWGFEKFGTHIFLLGDDPQTDWLMKKELLTPKQPV